jgi:hypothetical protein
MLASGFLPALVAAAAAAAPSRAAAPLAAISFTVTTRSESSLTKSASMADTTVKGFAAGDLARIEFTQSRNPLAPKGSFLLTLDGGKTVRLADPRAKSCRPWSPSGPAAGKSTVGSAVATRFENVSVARTLDEAGPGIAGLPTRHFRFTIAYDSIVDVMGTVRRSHTEKVADVWAAPELSAAGVSVWLRALPAPTGDADLDRKIKGAMAGLPGTPVKTVTTATVRDDTGFEQKTTTTVELTRLARTRVPASAFAVPAFCGKAAPPAR